MRDRRRSLAIAVLLSAVAYGVLEAWVRLAQGGCYSAMPFRREAGFPTLPPSSTYCFINSERAHITYVTDSEGARRASRAEAVLPCRHCVMAVGDSQALGYGLPYDATFTALYAARHGREAVLVAAPTDDPGVERLASAHYVAATDSAPDTLFVVVNFGNDIDELLLGRQSPEATVSWLSSWLPEHSFVFGDLALAGRIVTRRFVHSSSMPPGINPVAFALERGEVPVVASELARAVDEVIRGTRARAAVAVVIPTDTVVDAREFGKYRKYYSAAEYATWRARLPSMAAVMNSIEDELERRLRASGVRVLDTRHILAQIPATLAFDRYSHHLTKLSNRLIAGALK